MRTIDAIVLHCTAHRDDNSFGIGVREIRLDHMRATAAGGRGWDDVGYHYVVRRNGEIEVGRMESTIGAHCQNGYNQRSIGIAWVGTDKPTSEQSLSLLKLTRELVHRYGVQLHEVKGHKEADPGSHKACPGGLDMIAFRTEVSRV